MKKIKVTFQPRHKTTRVKPGTSLKEAIEKAQLNFEFPCGGKGKCQKCLVKILKGIEPPTLLERKDFDENMLREGYRLACVTKVYQETVIEVIEEGEESQHKIMYRGSTKKFKKNLCLEKICVDIDKSTLKDYSSYYEFLMASLGKDLDLNFSSLGPLEEVIEEADSKVTVLTDGKELLNLEKGDTREKLLGMAVDIGTTTLAGYLMDLVRGEELEVVSLLNPQSRYGCDIITRVSYVEEEKGLEKLHSIIIDGVNRLMEEAVNKAGASLEDLYVLSITGNTFMHHLFLGINPSPLAHYPNIPVLCQGLELKGKELGLNINPGGIVCLLPIACGFIGADAISAIMDTELDRSDKIKLVLDIGTNGEIILGCKDRVLAACSAAAGPAFEGPQISCGMRAVKGAIEGATFGEDVEVEVIGDEKPRGVCGSGLIDIVAGLLEKGIIDPRGRILSPEEVSASAGEALKNRIKKIKKTNAFLLVDQNLTAHGKPIYITQRDVRELQLAKGAIYTGIQILLDNFEIKADDLEGIYLAGTFGSYLKPESACTIGLLPPQMLERTYVAGNAAGSGAKLVLLSKEEFKRAEELARVVEYVDLSFHPGFNELLPKFLSFPDPLA